MNIYEYMDYKKFLASQIQENASVRGYQTKLAEAAGCQRAFVSQVMSGTVHLTFDHAAGLCDFWNFQEAETNYFFELLHLARAGTPILKKRVLAKIEQLKSPQAESSEAQQSLYYSSWIYAAVHALTSIHEFKTPKAVSDRLNLPLNIIVKVFDDLAGMKIIEQEINGYSPSKHNLFLSRQSHMTYMLHSNWRLQALHHFQKGALDSIHYSSLYTLSKDDFVKLREFILNFLKDSKHLNEKSQKDEIVCLNLDFFRL